MNHNVINMVTWQMLGKNKFVRLSGFGFYLPFSSLAGIAITITVILLVSQN